MALELRQQTREEKAGHYLLQQFSVAVATEGGFHLNKGLTW